MNQPNILFIQVDQLTTSSLKMYGDKICKAPNLEALAENGIVFESAYCNFPLCAPSRFSMATGQLCSKIGAYDNAAEMPASVPTYAHYLRNLGYQTALSGKMHFIGPDQYHGFERRLTADLYPADFSWVPNWGDEGKRDTNDSRGVLISGVCERSVQIDFDENVTQMAIQHLHDLAHSDDDRPFFLQVSYTHPHEPYLCKKEFWDMYEHENIPLPTTGAMSESEHDAHSVRLLKDFSMLDVEFKDEDILRAKQAYYGSISYIDLMIGKILDMLRIINKDKNTVIVFTSDHGEMLGERGMWFKKHFFEQAMRIPLLMYVPWIKPQRILELVSLVDLLPTFNGLATGKNWQSDSESLEGTDLTALFNQKESTPTRSVYAEYLAEATPVPIFMIRRGQYKFISSSHDPDLLFDLQADPTELNNLALNSDYRNLVNEFESEVKQKWNEPELTKQIILSQKRRQLIKKAQNQGAPMRWNHGESPNEKVPWYRGEGSYNDWAFDYS